MKSRIITFYPYLILIITLISTLMSLFFSEILHLTPCVLCWYQRICMYPLVAISAVAISRKNKELPYYILPLTIIGLFIAVYHNLLYYHILPESIAPCKQGVSCTTRQLVWFGWFTIPLGSLISFTILNTISILYLTVNKSFHKQNSLSKSNKKK